MHFFVTCAVSLHTKAVLLQRNQEKQKKFI